jgi:hypothetical protein
MMIDWFMIATVHKAVNGDEQLLADTDHTNAPSWRERHEEGSPVKGGGFDGVACFGIESSPEGRPIITHYSPVELPPEVL